jgi:lysyl-tRNA synthetase class 2
MSDLSLSEQELGRREKLQKIRDLGVDPYPAALFPISHLSNAAKSQYNADKETRVEVSMAGRIMSVNDKGKVLFIKILDSEGLIQLYVKRDDICPTEDKTFFDEVVKILDLGDFIGVKGYMFTTKTGEDSIHSTEITLLSKSLKPMQKAMCMMLSQTQKCATDSVM